MKRISLIGCGKLGLGFGLLLEQGGYEVLAAEIDKAYIEKVNNRTFQTQEPEYMKMLKTCKNLSLTDDRKKCTEFSDIIFIFVQTPNGGGRKFYDHTILSNVLSDLNDLKLKNKHIIINCTVMPGYIRDIGNCLLKDCINTTLSYNPEFIAQGEIIKGMEYPDMILFGTHSDLLKSEIETLYKSIVKNNPEFCFVSPLESEIIKISVNGFITTKISFANMLSDLCDNLNADKKKVLDCIGKDKRIGNNYFKPGYSFGGPCFPRDTRALALLMENNNIQNNILKSTSEYNNFHSEFMVNKLLEEGKEEYIIHGVCYKENSSIPIIEDSAKLNIAYNLVKKGKKVVIEDTIEIIKEVRKEYGDLFSYKIKK